MYSKNKVEVRIAGKDYKLCGVEEPEYIQKIALYVDRKMMEVLRANSTLSTSMASVLTALNIADEVQKLSKEKEGFKEQLKELRISNERVKGEKKQVSMENAQLVEKTTRLQLELAKREAELSEVRNTLEKATGGGTVKTRLHNIK